MNTDKNGFDFELITPEERAELETREVSLHCCGCGYVNDE